MRVAERFLARLFQEFGGKIELYHANGIVMVFSDDEVKMFLQRASLDPLGSDFRHSPGVRGVSADRKERTAEPLDSLMRRRAGYVPANAKIFLQALSHAVGDFGREMQAVSIVKK